MSIILPQDWSAIGVESLEPAAERVVRSNENVLVVAGPGAGKTELLAQRASYLLDTRGCPWPQRILAISFKRDAAKNLAERVKKRCGTRASRFDSFTLDAFGKSLVDRFRGAIPKEWQPVSGYQVMVKPPSVRDMRIWFESVQIPEELGMPTINALENSQIRSNFELCVHAIRLPYEANETDPLVRHLGICWWRARLALRESHPSLSFPMLNRLAAYLLRSNPKIANALRATYSHVFMDEFQDTTSSQYDVIESAFLRSRSIVTAVGDSKQRIMVWAGAMKDAFKTFEERFSATRQHLVRNYRSVPELVRIQDVIAKSIESETMETQSAKNENVKAPCSVVEFGTPEQEAEYLVNLIDEGITQQQLGPRDFCIVTRQKAGDMTSILRSTASRSDIQIRDESVLQDLLSEPVTEIILALLRLATRERDPQAWESLQGEIGRLHGLCAEENGSLLSLETERLVASTKKPPHQNQWVKTYSIRTEGSRGFVRFRNKGNFSFVKRASGASRALAFQFPLFNKRT